MYLVPEKTKIDKLQNQETLKAAKAMKAKRTVQLQEGKAGIEKKRKDMLLTAFIQKQMEEYEEKGKSAYSVTLGKINKWLKDYKHSTSLHTVDRDFLLGFCRHMKDSGLSEGTIHMYFANLNTVFNNAIRADLLDYNPISRISPQDKPGRPETEREYLTFKEVKRLMATECPDDSVKRAFLFACFTGLRLSDVEALTWDRIRKSGKGYQVEIRQIKTKKIAYIPLSENALSQLPHSKKKDGKVFPLPSRFTIGVVLKDWVDDAKIKKHITFHCSRHTYATMLLSYGADLYTVSSLLGHTDISTTQIYAKVMDKNKRKATNLIPTIGER